MKLVLQEKVCLLVNSLLTRSNKQKRIIDGFLKDLKLLKKKEMCLH